MDIKPLAESYMSWRDIAEHFSCGRNKALLIMHKVGVVRFGQTNYVKKEDLARHLEKHGSIEVKWPKRPAYRRRIRHACK